MTPTRRRECLYTIGWPQRLLARRMGWSEGTVRAWFRGTEAPPELDAWLERRAAAMIADPPPKPARR